MMRRILIALVCALFAAPALAGPAAPAGLKLERAVMLMRHGIRPPTKPTVTPPGVAAEAWPNWDSPWGHLTAHGAQAVVLLGRSDRAQFAGRGLLSAQGCPDPGAVVIWADTDQRTIATGEALAQGLAPGCAVAVGHDPEGQVDPLFSPLDAPGALDGAKALAAVRAQAGDLRALMTAHADEVALAERILGCCRPPACKSPCGLADLPSDLVMPDDSGRPKATGPLDFLPTAAQSIMLAYVEGKPMAEVGWGRVTPAELTTLMRLHSLKGQVLQRPPYVAARGAGPLARRMLAALTTDPALLTILVGHDTNIVDLGGLLDLHWQVKTYPADTPPPGGAVVLELLRAPDGKAYLRAVYRSQTMDQMRNLTPLGADQDADRQVLVIPGCQSGPGGLCPLADFAARITAPPPAA